MDKIIGKQKNGLTFATWNTRTLFKPITVQCLVKEVKRYRREVVALQEIRWNGDLRKEPWIFTTQRSFKANVMNDANIEQDLSYKYLYYHNILVNQKQTIFKK